MDGILTLIMNLMLSYIIVTNKYCLIYILIYIQQDMLHSLFYQDAMVHSLFYLETAVHVLGGTSAHHQEHILLYLQHLVFVTNTRCCRYSCMRS